MKSTRPLPLLSRFLVLSMLLATAPSTLAAEPLDLSLEWEKNYLTIRGEEIPGGKIEIHYLEAYCRPNSHTTDWREHTLVGHTTELVSAREDGTRLELRCRVNDGTVVDHVIATEPDGVSFKVTAHNPTGRPTEAHWAQPCVRVGEFTGTGPDATDDKYAYIRKSFVFLDGELATMPTKDWATEARYAPGQVWRAPGISASDVNPRPLNPHVPSNGLIGCFSGDETQILALAWEPYQELFQGVIRCLHSDFHIGGLQPGESKEIFGRLYIVPNDIPALLETYRRDFPTHAQLHCD